MKKINIRLIYLFLFLFAIFGLWFRFEGVQKNLSYWNDESNVAIYSKAVMEKGIPTDALDYSTGIYQIGLNYLTATSFKIFGVNEFAGRFPSVAAGTLLILSIFYITKKLIGNREALIASFLVAFSQIQLAWSTQLRPYIWLELFTLLVTYFSYQSLKEKRIIDKNIIYAFLISITAFLFHGTGLMNILLIALVILYKTIKAKKYIYLISLLPLGLIVLGVMMLSFGNALPLLFKFDFNILHYRIFLTHSYWWLLLGAVIGGLALWDPPSPKASEGQRRELVYILGGFTIIIFLIAIFKINTQYVRYSLPAFPLLYILFAAGIVGTINKVNEIPKGRIFNAISTVIILILFFAFPILKGKILLKPQYYYSINADVRENPIVDYKYAFNRIDKLTNNLDKNKVIIMDAWYDRVEWYLPEYKFGWLFKTPGYKNIPVATSSTQLKQVMKKYPYGITIVENWESLTPAQLQEYIRKNLKHEFDVNNLPYNENDKWSISVYSWGL